MHGNYNKPAFTLLELLLVMLVLGILASIMVPAFRTREPSQQREQFLSQLNALIGLAWRHAVTTAKPTKVVFNFTKRLIYVEGLTGQQDRNGNPISQPVKAANASMKFPERYQVKNFFIERFDEAKRFIGRATGESWFFIMPGGLAQEVIINLVDTQDKKAGKPFPVGLVLNPFTAQFKIYNEFQK